MAEVMTIKAAVQRARSENLPVSEYALRLWVKNGEIPHRKAGSKILIYYPTIAQYLRCESILDN